MGKAGSIKLLSNKAAEVCGQIALSDDALKLLKADQGTLEFLDSLIGKERFPDAARFLARALPKREAVWWACKCIGLTAGDKAPAKRAAALKAAEKWVADPTDENRQAAFPAAEAADFGTPEGCAAMAAFWSGGSLAPPNVPAVPPAEHLTAQGVAGAIMLTAVQSEPEKAAEKFRRYFSVGIEIARGEGVSS
ncbi:MAG: DUF6931 family protein [Gemmataceae bacterium]